MTSMLSATETTAFKIGQLVRIKGEDEVGRIVENDGNTVNVRIFGEPGSPWGEESNVQDFTTDHLELLAPVQPFNLLDELLSRITTIMSGMGIIGSLADKALNESAMDREITHEQCEKICEPLEQIALLTSVFVESTCDVLDILSDASRSAAA